MKKYLTMVPALILALSMALTMGACSDDNSPSSGEDNTLATEKEAMMQSIANQYVNYVIYPTYADLAEETSELYNRLEAVRDKFKNDPARDRKSVV